MIDILYNFCFNILQAWLKVASEFNKEADLENQRSMKQLRICYENIKRKMKRENISPFEYYSKKPPNHMSKKMVPILPKPQDQDQEGDEPENMLVMVNPDMVTPDLFDSNDATNLSCEGKI
jgi:Myb/SANT-like DNA-binding domain